MSKFLRLVVILTIAFGFLGGTGVASADVDPPAVEVTLAAGESHTVTKMVDVPEVPPQADVYFLADTTGSMGDVIAAVRTGASIVLGSIQAAIGDVQFGAGQYKDFPFDVFAFSNDAAIGPDDGVGGSADASDAINAWTASGGADGSEGQLFALDQIADPADPQGIGWRAGSSRILVWFGDAPGHDPVCSAISGLADDITEASATAKLVDGDIIVVAISTTTGFLDGLDDDPAANAFNYSGICVIGGSSGQATRIAAATSGSHLTGVDADGIVDAILDGIEAITLDVTATAVGCGPLEVSFTPEVHEDVAGPTQVVFEETIHVPADVAVADLPPGGVVECTVEFLASGAVIATQLVSVSVPLEIDVPVDIKPQSCPNPLNCKSNGVLPVAILGTAELDVTQIDPSSVRLEGIAPLRWALEDVGTSFGPLRGKSDCFEDCTTAGADGFTDLSLKFDTQEVLAAIGPGQDEACLVLQVTGNLTEAAGGTPIVGEDVVRILCKGGGGRP